MSPLNRRDAIGLMAATASALGAATVGVSSAMAAEAPAIAPAFAGKHEPKPLPFDPARLKGLSEKILRSHWENNYIGSVKALNMIEQRLGAAMREADFPPLIYGGLKREELHRTGSVVLHENYFGNLGGDGKAGGEVMTALKMRFGAFDVWEAEFRRTGMSLAVSASIPGIQPTVEIVVRRLVMPICGRRRQVASTLSRFIIGSPIPMNTRWSTSSMRRKCRTWSRISLSDRFRPNFIVPVAQNVQVSGQPDCEETQTERRPSRKRIRTASTGRPSWVRKSALTVPSSASSSDSTVRDENGTRSCSVSRRSAGMLLMSS